MLAIQLWYGRLVEGNQKEGQAAGICRLFVVCGGSVLCVIERGQLKSYQPGVLRRTLLYCTVEVLRSTTTLLSPPP